MHSFLITNLLFHSKYLSNLQPNKPFQSIYPSNINLSNYFYFIYCVPSLVYETKFQRSDKIRPLYVLKELAGFWICVAGVLWIMAQYVLPVTTASIQNDSFLRLFDDLVAVSVPGIILWLLGFYAYFHCWLNAKAELVMYANREFYKDWWNADSIGDFWRKWNLPVHEWCLRHVYIDSMHYINASKDIAILLVFICSAVLHELVVSFGFKVHKPYFFVAMCAQAPLVLLNKKIREKSKRMGNILVWISLMFGQPLLAILYFRNWVKSNDPSNFWCR